MADEHDTMVGPIREVGFKQDHRTGTWRPSLSHVGLLTHVAVLSGRVVERTPTGWQVAPHTIKHDPEQVLLWLRRQAEAEQTRADRRAEARKGSRP